MRDVFICPECGHEDDHVNYQANYNAWGRSWGTYMPYDGHDRDDYEINDAEDEDHEYECPGCGAGIADPDACFYEEDTEEIEEARAEAGKERKPEPVLEPKGGNE